MSQCNLISEFLKGDDFINSFVKIIIDKIKIVSSTE
jgi:hypothetical protein